MKQSQLILESDELSLTIDPDCGGKWRRLYDRRTQHEWLWTNPHLPVEVDSFDYDESYIDKMDTGGWDEVFPSVDPCYLEGLGDIPDHGDLVRLPWVVDSFANDRVHMLVQGRCLPFLFERSIHLKAAEILCEYRLTNQGEHAFPWLWCAHSLLPLTSELKLELAGMLDVRLAMGDAKRFEGAFIKYDELSDLRGTWAVKLFSRRHELREVTVCQPNGSRLRLSWVPQQIPYLGIWVNHGVWSGGDLPFYYNIGLEPTTLPFDDLSVAPNPPILEPGQTVSWQLRINCSTA